MSVLLLKVLIDTSYVRHTANDVQSARDCLCVCDALWFMLSLAALLPYLEG
jgi:hypothetical protein